MMTSVDQIQNSTISRGLHVVHPCFKPPMWDSGSSSRLYDISHDYTGSLQFMTGRLMTIQNLAGMGTL